MTETTPDAPDTDAPAEGRVADNAETLQKIGDGYRAAGGGAGGADPADDEPAPAE